MSVIPGALIFKMVVIIFMETKIYEAPIMCTEKMKNVIDYAWSNLKSDRLDFCIIGKARFMIGNTSGITCLASVMGIPCAVTNVVPFCVGWLTEKDIFIPKYSQN